jgi:hypothetical protein
MRVVTAALLVGAAGLLTGASACFRGSQRPVHQPIAFNHSKHVQDLGLVCTTCHLYAETGPRATIPNIEVCEMCHAQPLTESPEEAVLIEHIQSGEPIRWLKVYRVPAHVYFSHRRHTSVAKIACETCHGAIGERVAPVSRPLVKITMNRCLDCHQSEGASSDCIACHR